MESCVRYILTILSICTLMPVAWAGDKTTGAQNNVSKAAMIAMIDKLSGCWSIPAKALPEDVDAFKAEIVVHLRPDGSLAEKPMVRKKKKKIVSAVCCECHTGS